MLNRISRRTYGLACLAIFVAIVLAGCPAAITKPTAAKKLADIAALDVGDSATVDIRGVFKGEKLEYSVRSDAQTVASAQLAENNQSVTIVAVGAGTATITVTAKNDGGSVARSFKVTVPPPATTPTPTTPTPEPEPEIDADYSIRLNESVKHTLSSGQSLQAPPSGGVTVGRSQDGESDNVWLITAKKKGTHKVIVLEEGRSVGTITVVVPNSRPIRQDQKGTITLSNPRIELSSVASSDTVVVHLTKSGAALAADNPGIMTDYFTDADTEDRIRFRIEDKPSWFLIETENGFLEDQDVTLDGLQLGYEVLQKVVPSNEREYEFTVSLYASDGEEEATRPVVIEFSVDDTAGLPLVGKNYPVDQDDVSGNFRDGRKDGSYNNRLEVGPRREVTHTVTFQGTAGGLSGTGFVFVENEHIDIDSGDRPTNLTPTVLYRDGRNAVKTASDGMTASVPTDYQVPGTRYFLIKGTGAVVVEGGVTDSITIDASAKVSFSLKGGSSGSIAIEYKIWLAKGVVDNSTDDNPNNDANNGKTRSTASDTKTLTISVLNCSSPPDPIADCP